MRRRRPAPAPPSAPLPGAARRADPDKDAGSDARGAPRGAPHVAGTARSAGADVPAPASAHVSPDVSPDDLALLRTVGNQILLRRRERGLTRAGLAAAAGLSTRFLANLEGGAANVSLLNLAHLARALGTTPQELLEAPRQRSIALLGLRGAGKTTIGRTLSARLGMPLVELDQLVEEQAGLPLREIFAVHGDAYFRRMEAQALEAFLARPRPAVLATGGGIVTSPGTWDRLRRACFTVWLRARPEDHMARVEKQGDLRPMSRRPNAMAELRQILAARAPLYALADLTVDTSALPAAAAVRRIAAALGADAPDGPGSL